MHHQPIKRVALFVSILAAALPLWPVHAAGRLSQHAGASAPLTFAIAPGTPLVTHRPLQRYFDYTFSAGNSLADKLAVMNFSRTSAVTVSLGVADGVTSPQQGGIYYLGLRRPHNIGRWLSLGQHTVTVPPYSYVLLPITVSVPAGVLPGQYEGAIQATSQQAIIINQGKLHTSIRGTVQCIVLLQVRGAAVPGLQIVRAAYPGPYLHANLNITVKNTGTLIDHPLTTVVTFAGSGKSYTVQPRLGDMLGGASTVLSVPTDKVVPAGSYRVTIRITYLARRSSALPLQRFQTTWHGTLDVP